MAVHAFQHNPLFHNDPFILISVQALGTCGSTLSPVYVLIMGTKFFFFLNEDKIRQDKIALAAQYLGYKVIQTFFVIKYLL